ncbi:MAG: tail fiber protein [Bacteroidota bacterium]
MKNSLIKLIISLWILPVSLIQIHAQVGINENNANPDASAMLDVSSTNKGLLIPRMNSTNRESINNPATGLMVFDTTTNSFWYYSGSWQEIGKSAFTSQNGITFSNNQADDFVVGADSLNHGSGEEHKLFFNKEKGAFRVGTISNTSWNSDNLGQYSFAGGNNSKASQPYTFAFGSAAVASNSYANAFGQNTTASGQYATVFGVSSNASGNYTLAGGLGVDATETFSIAFGNNIEVNGSASAAFGNFHKLEGSSVFAAGQGHIIKNGWSTALGLSNKTNGSNATAIGLFSTANGDYSTVIGSSLTAASFGETAIGLLNTNYTPNDTAAYHPNDRLFVIGNGSSFSNRSDALRIYKNGNAELNGTLTIDSAYTFPNVDGLANQSLVTNGNGALTWSSNSTLQDTDGDTQIQVEKDSNDDMIRFDLDGTEYLRLDSGRMEILNTGGSVFIGESAGDNDDFSDNKNVFIGYTAGNKNTTGENNVMIGNIAGALNTNGSNNAFFGSYAGSRNEMGEYNAFLGANAGERNVNGDYNTYVGTQAGRLNTSGSNNIFIGYQAGANQSGSNKLYIHNNPSNRPLIFGDFARDSLQINAKLNINGAFNFPTVDGTANQVLQTDGNGTIVWADQPIFTDTDNQTIDKLNLNGTTLELSLENDNADDQTLDLATLKDNLGNHTATQNVATNGFYLSNDGDDEGIFINHDGKVGIGTSSPTDRLEVPIGAADSSPQTIISNLTEDKVESISSAWQSYTATISGTLGTISIPRSGFTIADWTVTIHQGEGTAGTVLGTLTANTNYDFSSLNISQTASQTYTIAITIASGEFDPYSNADYDGGVSSLAQDRDIAFELSIIPVVGGKFTVGENGLVINNYSLPVTDGAANQVLQTDGNGTVAWTNQPTFTDTDDQKVNDFSLSGNSLRLTLENDVQGQQSVDLSSFKDNTDDQTIDKLNLNGTTLEVSLEGDGPVDKTVNLASLNTDNQTLSINNTTLSISGGNSVDLTNLVPIGTIQMWPTSSPPMGWLICNGSNFNASDYSQLNIVLGGNTLPNFNGRFPLGVGDSGTSGSTNHNIGTNGGEEKHTLSINEMPNHSHGAGSLSTSEPYLSQEGSGNQDKRDGGGTKLFEYTSISGSTASVGGGQAHNNMPPFYTINFIIKAR